MSITIKSERAIELMTESGRILEIVHEELEKKLTPGITTRELNKIGEEVIRSYGCEPSFLNYDGYPASICVSINNEIVHGIPSDKRFINEGDIVSIDAGVIYRGYHSDAARTYGIGEINDDAKRLIRVTEESFFEGIKFAKEGNHLFDISCAIGHYAEKHGYAVIRELFGHGIGTHLHEEPDIPNYVVHKKGPELKAGMTLAIEPMLSMKSNKIKVLRDGWTIVTRDGQLSSHYENTILITNGDPVILTLTKPVERK